MAMSVEASGSSMAKLDQSRAAVLAGSRANRCAQSSLHVLMYHRIGDARQTPDLNPVTLSATPDDFARQIELFTTRYNVVGIHDVVASLTEARPLPQRALLITFDDAYDCFLRYAWPVLHKFHAPATMFVATSFPDSHREFWWDRVHRLLNATASEGRWSTPAGDFETSSEADRRRANHRVAEWVARTSFDTVDAWLTDEVERLGLPLRPAPVMTWNELRSLSAQGLTVAPHSRTHPPLTCISSDRLRDEVQGSIADLKRESLDPAPAFAYPGGYVDERVVEAVAAAGCHVAMSTRRGGERVRTCDPLRLRRINVGRRATLWKLRLQLALPPAWLNRVCDYLQSD